MTSTASSPTSVAVNGNNEFWQKSSSRNGTLHGGGLGSPGPPPPPAIADPSIQYYWNAKTNPFYDYKHSPIMNGNRIPNGTTTVTMGRDGRSMVGPPNGTPTSMAARRNPFPLSLPLYQNLPRARLREEEGGQPPMAPRGPPGGLPRGGMGGPLGGGGNNNSMVGYKLAQQLPGSASPPPPVKNGVRLEAEREGERRRTTASASLPPPHTAIAPPPTYGEKSLSSRVTPPRRGSGSSSKPPRWGRFMQTICCCISPQQENPEKPRPIVVNPPPPLSNGSPIAQLKPSSNGMSSGASVSLPSTGSATGGASASPPSNFASIITQADANGVQQNGYLDSGDTGSPINGLYKPIEKLLLPPVKASDVNKKCLIIDLDETLVHSSFKPVKNPDFVIPVEIDGVVHQVYVLKRPYVDEFLARVGEKFECVLFTASLAKYADPVADLLDKRGVFRSRLFREACVFHKGNYIKDLARLGRDLNRTLIVDNSPTSYAFHPENAIPVQTWFDDPSDVELLDILPLLDRLAIVDSVYSLLRPRDSSPEVSLPALDRSYS